MLFDFSPPAESPRGDTLGLESPIRWGVDSEYGRLTDVMVAAPQHLELVPCNAVAIENSSNGIVCCPDRAGAQHERLIEMLEAAGVRCHLVPAAEALPDLAFTRDATFMTPWGLLGLNPAAGHRTAEVDHILGAARSWGVPLLGKVGEGHVEGGDLCLLRPGFVAIGYSGERTDEAGAAAVARLFEARGWKAIRTRFSPEFLHLDTQFTFVDSHRAVACPDTLDAAFLEEIEALGIDIAPVTRDEVRGLGANILSLGDGRLLSLPDNRRVNGLLERLGYVVIPVEIDQFTRCGGGIHCLTMPLARLPG